MNILTFDTEEWFHLLDNDSTRDEKQWVKYPVRIYQNVDRVLQILEDTGTTATFFIIGWVAKTYPDIVKKISSKYQIASHTMNHQLVWQQSKSEFKEDVYSSISLLEDISGKKVELFRAPGFSFRESEAWAFEILYNLGIKIDCSVFPAHHAHGGMPSVSKAVPSIIEYNGIRLKEFPIPCKNILGRNLIFSGGGYFRLIPYKLLKNWTEQSDYIISYIHPRDLDAGQPMIKELPLKRKFKSYYGLKGAEKKLRQWLTDFRFTDVATADKITDWDNAPIIKL